MLFETLSTIAWEPWTSRERDLTELCIRPQKQRTATEHWDLGEFWGAVSENSLVLEYTVNMFPPTLASIGLDHSGSQMLPLVLEASFLFAFAFWPFCTELFWAFLHRSWGRWLNYFWGSWGKIAPGWDNLFLCPGNARVIFDGTGAQNFSKKQSSLFLPWLNERVVKFRTGLGVVGPASGMVFS